MAVTDWIDISSQVGAPTTKAVAANGGYGLVTGTKSGPWFVSGDFPTTPTDISGVELEFTGYSSVPGIIINTMSFQRQWRTGPIPIIYTGGFLASMVPNQPVPLVEQTLGIGGFNALIYGAVPAQTGFEGTGIGPVFTSPPKTSDVGTWTGFLTVDSDYGAGLFGDVDGGTVQMSFYNPTSFNAVVTVTSVRMRLWYYDSLTVRMSGSGTASATARKGKVITRALSGSGTASGTARAQRVIAGNLIGTSRLDGVVTRSSGGVKYTYAFPAFVGSGVVGVTQPSRYRGVRANLVGSGVIGGGPKHAIPVSVPDPNGRPTMSGRGTLSGVPVARKVISGALVGSGIATASALKQRPITGALVGSGVASVAMIAKRVVSGALVGSAAASVSLRRVRPVPTQSLVGTGSASVSLILMRAISAALSGSGVITVNESLITSNTRLRAGEHCTLTVPSRDRVFEVPSRPPAFEVTQC